MDSAPATTRWWKADPVTAPPRRPAVVARERARERLRSEEFDLLVVGGGVTGAGVALDAASRGMSVALVDKGDWASGTSSKSSKLVHGGLRYLQQKEYRLVYENLRERQRLLRNAPHIVRVMPFLIPLFGKQGVVSSTVAKAYSTALTLYDVTGGWRIGTLHKRLDVAETVAHMGGLAKGKVAAGFLYFDAQADDARLTLGLVRTAADHGAVVLNHCGVGSFTTSPSGRVTGAVLDDGSTVRARCVVNATGVWAEQVAALAGPVTFTIRPAKGIHIVVPFAKIRADIAAVVPVRSDKRSVFVVPAFDSGSSGTTAGAPSDRIYIGTTDTDYDGPLDAPICTPADIRYVLDGINDWLEQPLTEDDVIGTWAGLRPLLGAAKNAKTADLSRRHQVVRAQSDLVSILGGKLTTYRQMAEDTVDECERVLGRRHARCRTRRLPLRGAPANSPMEPGAAERLRVDPAVLRHLIDRYGSEAPAVAALIRTDPSLGAPLVSGLSYLRAEAVHAVRVEQARTLEDVLSRRTRALLLDTEATVAAAAATARLIAPELVWSPGDEQAELERFRAFVRAEKPTRKAVPA